MSQTIISTCPPPPALRSVTLACDGWVAALREALARAESGETRGGCIIEDSPDAQRFAHAGIDRVAAVGALTIAANGLAGSMGRL